jgi:hypothetical protein
VAMMTMMERDHLRRLRVSIRRLAGSREIGPGSWGSAWQPWSSRVGRVIAVRWCLDFPSDRDTGNTELVLAAEVALDQDSDSKGIAGDSNPP